MKKIIGIALVLLFVLVIILPYLRPKTDGSPHYVQFETVEQLQQYLRYAPGKTPLIGAHRGGPEKEFPENAIETFQHTLRYAPCLIECDVRKTGDGQLVFMHDASLDRTTTGNGAVSDYTLPELRKLRLKDNYGTVTDCRIPTIGEVLNWAVGKAILELDIKAGVTPEEILQAILQAKALPYVVIITYTIDQLEVYRDLHPELMISASAKSVEGVQRVLATGINPRRLLVFVGVSEPAPEVYELLHQNGIRAILGTMHNIDNKAAKRGIPVYLKVLKNGADILATDNVPLAARAIRQFEK